MVVAKADLEILAGSYAAKERPVEVKVALADDRLRLSVTEGPPLRGLLIPTSPLRFRCEGDGLAPGLAVRFQIDRGKATQLTVLQPGMPELILERTD